MFKDKILNTFTLFYDGEIIAQCKSELNNNFCKCKCPCVLIPNKITSKDFTTIFLNDLILNKCGNICVYLTDDILCKELVIIGKYKRINVINHKNLKKGYILKLWYNSYENFLYVINICTKHKKKEVKNGI